MSDRDIGLEILQGIQEIKEFKAGKRTLKSTHFPEPSPPKVIREKLHLSQLEFANLLGASVRTLQDWEQGRRSPKGRQGHFYM